MLSLGVPSLTRFRNGAGLHAWHACKLSWALESHIGTFGPECRASHTRVVLAGVRAARLLCGSAALAGCTDEI